MTNREELLRRISIDPTVCFDKPYIRGARICVENLTEGVSESRLLAASPQLQSNNVRAALTFAAETA
jgi:uncharacterized protein (DUF433 family)